MSANVKASTGRSKATHRVLGIVPAIVLAAVAVPFVPLILWSVSNGWFFPAVLPQHFGLRAWHYLTDTAGLQIADAIAKSVMVAAGAALLSVIVGIPAGRALGLYRFRAKELVGVVLALPVIVPPLSVAMGLHLWFLKLGLADSVAGVVLIHLSFCLPYAVFVMWGVFSAYNPEFEDQARSLGASQIQVLRRVTFPLVARGIVVAGLFSFLLSWSQYLSTLIIGGGKIVTLPILLFSLMGSGDRPVAAAVSLVFVAPALGVLVFSARHLGARSMVGIR